MKEMIYQAEFKREVLDTGYCLGLLYFILNLGSHPTKIRVGGKKWSTQEIYQEVREACYDIQRRKND